jgi:hypothetical protein
MQYPGNIQGSMRNEPTIAVRKDWPAGSRAAKSFVGRARGADVGLAATDVFAGWRVQPPFRPAHGASGCPP